MGAGEATNVQFYKTTAYLFAAYTAIPPFCFARAFLCVCASKPSSAFHGNALFILRNTFFFSWTTPPNSSHPLPLCNHTPRLPTRRAKVIKSFSSLVLRTLFLYHYLFLLMLADFVSRDMCVPGWREWELIFILSDLCVVCTPV